MKEWLKANDVIDTQNFYDLKYESHGREAFTGYDWRFFFKSIEDLFGRPRPTDAWLDCGCGHGEFLEKVIARYKFSSPALYGIDLSGKACDLAEERFKNYEYKINIQMISMDYLPDYWMNYFEVVTSWGSIEHSMDPLMSLKNMIFVTKPGGFVMIAVPLEFQNCLDYIKAEKFNRNNERFMEYMEWLAYFSKIKKPIMTQKIEMVEGGDMLLVFKK